MVDRAAALPQLFAAQPVADRDAVPAGHPGRGFPRVVRNSAIACARARRSIRIWVSMPLSRAQVEKWEQVGAVPADKPRTRFRMGPVFDRSQVEELPPPPAIPVTIDCPILEVVGCELQDCIEPLAAFAGKIGSSVSFEAMCSERGGCGSWPLAADLDDSPSQHS